MIEKISTIYGRFFAWEGDEISEQLKRYSAHTRNELAMLKAFIKPGDNIIDVGAHIGTFSIPFALFNRGAGKVFSFEANPKNYLLFQVNIAENNLMHVIFSYQGIVTESDSRFHMLLPQGGNSGMYAFIPARWPWNLIPESWLTTARKLFDHQITAWTTCINLDAWHKDNYPDIPINLIKIDVEGAELSVLHSCQNLIQKYKPLLYIEVSDIALTRFGQHISNIEYFLKTLGYDFYRNAGERNSDNDRFELQTLQTLSEGGTFFDVLAVHPSNFKHLDGI